MDHENNNSPSIGQERRRKSQRKSFPLQDQCWIPSCDTLLEEEPATKREVLRECANLQQSSTRTSRRSARESAPHSVRFQIEHGSRQQPCETPMETPRHRNVPTSSSPQKLTRTNLRRLQRELDIHKSFTSKIVEQGVAHLKAKDNNLRKAIHSVSSFAFIVVLAGVLYGNYLMLIPHLNAIFMAGLLSLVLATVRDWLTSQVSRLRLRTIHKLSSISRPKLILGIGFAVALVAISPNRFGSIMAMTCCCIGSLIFLHPNSLVAALLTIIVLCSISIPVFLVLQQFVLEANIVAKFLMNLIVSDDMLQGLVNSINNSTLYEGIRVHVTSLAGREVIPKEIDRILLKDEVKRWARYAGTNLESFSGNILQLISNAGNLIWAFTTFSTTLFYLLSTRSWWETIDSLSPLSPQDNSEVYHTIRNSTTRILLCSSVIGAIHAISTYSILWMGDSPILALPSVFIGFFAVVPLWGTYVVFLPISCLLWAYGSQFAAVALVCSELTLTLLVDARVTSFIPGDRHFVGLSIVAGLYAFGTMGVLYGPLLVGLTSSIIKIYVKYLKTPLQKDCQSPMISQGTKFIDANENDTTIYHRNT